MFMLNILSMLQKAGERGEENDHKKNLEKCKFIGCRRNQRIFKKGGVEEEVKAPHEEWQIRQILPLLTTGNYYKKGTLYSTPSNSKDPAVFNVWQ